MDFKKFNIAFNFKLYYEIIGFKIFLNVHVRREESNDKKHISKLLPATHSVTTKSDSHALGQVRYHRIKFVGLFINIILIKAMSPSFTLRF